VIAAGGGNKYNKVYSDSLIAFALPSTADAQPLVSYSKAVAREAAAATQPQSVPARPEVFNHKRHAPLKLECKTCHATALTAERAGFPTGAACLTCHTDRTDLAATAKVVPGPAIYRLPDFIFFKHSRHNDAKIQCATCHGEVWTQDRLKPVLQMKMKACVDCHQSNHATVTCTACHELSQ
jgi:hypothetical protein